MLHLIRDYADRFFSFLLEDPVRPQIPTEQRVGTNRAIFVLHEEDRVDAITCVSYQNRVPEREEELFQPGEASIAVFYTIWSYRPGAGRRLILDCVDRIRQDHPTIKRFITLSPKTDMARKFHLRNGALICQENQDTINYEYYLDNIK
jgi:hypothetical protein